MTTTRARLSGRFVPSLQPDFKEDTFGICAQEGVRTERWGRDIGVMGPLEQEIVESMDRHLRATPGMLEALFEGREGVWEASPEETSQALMAMLVGQREAIRRIAREIDESSTA